MANGLNGNGSVAEKAKWALLSTVMLALAGGMGTVAAYWQGRDAQALLAEVRDSTAVERQRMMDAIRRDIDRLEARQNMIVQTLDRKVDQQQRLETMAVLQTQIERLAARLDRIDTLMFDMQVRDK